jgi:hypothetical protein
MAVPARINHDICRHDRQWPIRPFGSERTPLQLLHGVSDPIRACSIGPRMPLADLGPTFLVVGAIIWQFLILSSLTSNRLGGSPTHGHPVRPA